MEISEKNTFDYLLVGQGLAGTILSHILMQQGKKVLVINNYDPKSSSYIARGIFSPIAGQRIAKIWQADEITPILPDFYQKLEQLLGVNFFHQMPYIKLLIDDELKKFAERRLADPEYDHVIEAKEYRLKGATVPALEIKNTGWIDTALLLDTYRAYLQKQDAYLEERFDESQCVVNADAITYKHIHAKHLVFCNGLEVGNNRFFPETVFYPTKGEIITVKMQAQTDAIICGNVFALPAGNDLFHVGATFARTYADSLPTQAAKERLCSDLEKIIDVPYEIVDHRVGIRPTTPGHRPIYRWHETYPNVAIFSGFGAKGTSYIPYCATELLKDKFI